METLLVIGGVVALWLWRRAGKAKRLAALQDKLKSAIEEKTLTDILEQMESEPEEFSNAPVKGLDDYTKLLRELETGNVKDFDVRRSDVEAVQSAALTVGAWGLAFSTQKRLTLIRSIRNDALYRMRVAFLADRDKYGPSLQQAVRAYVHEALHARQLSQAGGSAAVGTSVGRKAASEWIRNDNHVRRELRFDTMTLGTRVNSSSIMDGEALWDTRKRLENLWKDELEDEGWTKAEWMDHGLQEFEVRRTQEARWETRLTHRFWQKRVTELTADLREGGIAAAFAKDEFQQLLGYSWDQWLNREKEPLPEGTERPWQKVDDEFAPSIETAYQRYLHQG